MKFLHGKKSLYEDSHFISLNFIEMPIRKKKNALNFCNVCKMKLIFSAGALHVEISKLVQCKI